MIRHFKLPSALALFAFALTLLAPFTGAQTVSNLAETSAGGVTTNANNQYIASSFTTGGTSTDRYTLNSVQIDLAASGCGSGAVSAWVFGASGQNPSNSIHNITLTRSGTTETFNPPASTMLHGATTYWLVVRETATGCSFNITNSNNQTGTTGWSIARQIRRATGSRTSGWGAWNSIATLMFAINPSTPGTPGTPGTGTSAPVYAPWDIVANGFDRRVSLAFHPVPRGTAYQYRQRLQGGGNYGSWTNIHHTIRVYRGGGVRAFAAVGGLTNGSIYEFQLRGINSIGNGPASVTFEVRPLAPPPTPTLNSATGVNGAVALDITGGATSTTRMTARTFVAEKAQCAGLSTAQCRERLDTVGYSWLSGNNELVGLTNGIEYTVRVLAANRQQDEPDTPLVFSAPSVMRTATPTGPPDPRCTHAIAGNGRISGEWRFGCNSAARPGRKAQYYTFTLDDAREVTLTLTSSIDPYLFVREGTIVDGSSPRYENDDSGGTRNSRIVASLQAGSYIVEAATYLAGRSGPFIFEIAGLAHDAPTPVETTTTTTTTGDGSAELFACAEWLAGDGDVSGAWTEDCASAAREDAYARYYLFSLGERATPTITVASTVDSYVYLRGGGTKDSPIIGEDDDNGDSHNAELTMTLDAGTYVIEATTYDGNQTGNFNLNVRGLGTAVTDTRTAEEGGLATPVAHAMPEDWGITLSWNAITGATGYEYEWVYADKAWWDTDWIKRRSVGADTLSAALRDEIGTEPYSFRVRAVRVADGEREESLWSRTVTARSN